MNKHVFTNKDLAEMERRYRANFINTLSGFRSANLIGTIDTSANIPNLAIFNSVMHIGANPPLMGFIMRPLTVERHTYDNIMQSKVFSINHVNVGIVSNAHHTSASYEKNVSEFEKAELNPFYSDSFAAPFVKESAVNIGLSFVESHEIKSNGTILIIGEIVEIHLSSSIIAEDGSLDLEATNGVAISGLDTYYNVKKIVKLPYARPK